MNIMRKSADWMVIWDDRILEITDEVGPTSASMLTKHDHIHTSRSTISRRLNKLADYGLLERLPNGVYMITDTGKDYLDNNVDANALEPKNN